MGIILVVPPQVYIERLNNAEYSGSNLDFWSSHAFRGIYPEGNFSWHHLWFLPYLLAFSLALTPLFLYFRNNPDNQFLNWIKEQVKAPVGFLWFLLPLYLAQILLKPYFPETHAFVGDWYTLVNYSLLFFYGFVLITIKEIFWKIVLDNIRIFLLSGMVFFSVYLLLVLRSTDIFLADYLIPLIVDINSWSWILALFGFAARYLNKKSTALSYANETVYPFYILHQTVIICLGYSLKDFDFGFWQKADFMVAGTFITSWILYEFLIRRIGFLRPLFGLKTEESKSTKAGVVAEV
ncbi:glucan biosynthesis protein [Salegentibacter sp. F188]|uniref:Glucan biosynthesis protein n=1 Tax=Autumnicola patrickiae TaxID=3075591 RepID=A0ABU3E5A3_9FLAO|nr:acyltransferase family protein [Salegentibacter sp. F188]MDT0691149.1 glucan biosynthesis protein [Salegentibacter sp. F188]